jgi:hypothetical protein
MYAVITETPRSKHARHMYFPRKPRDVGRQGTLIYVVTMKTGSTYMLVYYNSVVVSAVIVRNRLMCIYVYYTVALVPGEPLRS